MYSTIKTTSDRIDHFRKFGKLLNFSNNYPHVDDDAIQALSSADFVEITGKVREGYTGGEYQRIASNLLARLPDPIELAFNHHVNEGLIYGVGSYAAPTRKETLQTLKNDNATCRFCGHSASKYLVAMPYPEKTKREYVTACLWCRQSTMPEICYDALWPQKRQVALSFFKVCNVSFRVGAA